MLRFMLTSGSLAGAYATVKCNPRTRYSGITLAARFLFVNWLLDLLVLVPLMVPDVTGQDEVNLKTWTATVPHWFTKIGASYLAFVMVCVVAGESAERASHESKSQ